MHHISSAELLDLTVAKAILHTHDHQVAACRGPEIPASAPATMLHRKQPPLPALHSASSLFAEAVSLCASVFQQCTYRGHTRITVCCSMMHCCSALSLSPRFKSLRPGPLLLVWHSPISLPI